MGCYFLLKPRIIIVSIGDRESFYDKTKAFNEIKTQKLHNAFHTAPSQPHNCITQTHAPNNLPIAQTILSTRSIPVKTRAKSNPSVKLVDSRMLGDK